VGRYVHKDKPRTLWAAGKQGTGRG
jgi:hypothetical protein